MLASKALTLTSQEKKGGYFYECEEPGSVGPPLTLRHRYMTGLIYRFYKCIFFQRCLVTVLPESIYWQRITPCIILFTRTCTCTIHVASYDYFVWLEPQFTPCRKRSKEIMLSGVHCMHYLFGWTKILMNQVQRNCLL